MEQLDKHTAEEFRKERQRKIGIEIQRTAIVQPKFPVGDVVLVWRAHEKGHTLNLSWMSSLRIIKVHSDRIYDAMIYDGIVEEGLCARLPPYRHGSGSENVSKQVFEPANSTEAQFEIFEKIKEIGKDNKRIFLQIHCFGLSVSITFTCVSLQTMFKNNADAVINFIHMHACKKAPLTYFKQNVNLASWASFISH